MTRPMILAAALALAAGAAKAQAVTPGAEFLLQWDADKDGKVTLAEAEDRRGAIFEMFDMDGDGAFSDAEFALIDEHKRLEAEAGHGPGHGGQPGQGMGPGKAMGMGKGMGQRIGQGLNRAGGFDQPAREGMGMFDADGDGRIVRAEFVGGTSLWFQMRDRNADGVVTSADFGR